MINDDDGRICCICRTNWLRQRCKTGKSDHRSCQYCGGIRSADTCQKSRKDPELVYQAIRGGLAGSTVLDAKAPMMMDRNFKPGFRIELHIKDLNNALNAGHAVNAPLPLTSELMEIMQALKADGHEKEDHSSIVKFYEKISNTTVTRE